MVSLIPTPNDFLDWLGDQAQKPMDQAPISYTGPNPLDMFNVPFMEMPRSPQQAAGNLRNNVSNVAGMFDMPFMSLPRSPQEAAGNLRNSASGALDMITPSPQDLMGLYPGIITAPLSRPFNQQDKPKGDSKKGKKDKGGPSEEAIAHTIGGSRGPETQWINELLAKEGGEAEFYKGRKNTTAKTAVVLNNSGIKVSARVRNQFIKDAPDVIAGFQEGRPLTEGKDNLGAQYEVLTGYLIDLATKELESMNAQMDGSGQAVPGWNPKDANNPKNVPGATLSESGGAYQGPQGGEAPPQQGGAGLAQLLNLAMGSHGMGMPMAAANKLFGGR